MFYLAHVNIPYGCLEMKDIIITQRAPFRIDGCIMDTDNSEVCHGTNV